MFRESIEVSWSYKERKKRPRDSEEAYRQCILKSVRINNELNESYTKPMSYHSLGIHTYIYIHMHNCMFVFIHIILYFNYIQNMRSI